MQIHRVVQGDTLWRLAQRFGTTEQELATLNGLPPDSGLVPGLHLLVPSQQPAIPAAARDKRTIEVNGYLIPSGTNDAAIIQPIGNALTYLCIFSYQVTQDGNLTPQPDQLALTEAAQQQIAPLMTVTNFDGNNFNSDIARTVMSNTSIRQQAIQKIIGTAENKGFRGVNVDFEHMYPADRPLYNRFISDLGNAARARGLSISIAMGPKTSDEPQQSWMGAFDYRTLGQEVDYLMLMTYEWGWVGGPPLAGILQPRNHAGLRNHVRPLVPPSVEPLSVIMTIYPIDNLRNGTDNNGCYLPYALWTMMECEAVWC